MLTLLPFSHRRAVFRQQLQHPAVQEGELQSGGSPPSRRAAAESPEPRGLQAAVTKQRQWTIRQTYDEQNGISVTLVFVFTFMVSLRLSGVKGHISHYHVQKFNIFKQNHVNYKLTISVQSCHLLNVKTLKVLIFFIFFFFFKAAKWTTQTWFWALIISR